MTTDRIISRVGKDHQSYLVETLAAAFQTDPAFAWILPRENARTVALHRLFTVIVPGDLAAGMALASPDHEVATLWRSPGKAHTTPGEMIRQAIPLLRIFGMSIGRALAVAGAIDAHHPTGNDYWYLHYAGVRPACQGKGWGGAAIRAGIERAKAHRKAVFLETATPENVGLYQRLGFEVIREWDVPGGGPHFWSMIIP